MTPAADPRALFGEYRSDAWFPLYRAGTSGAWTVSTIAMAATRGYWGDTYRVNGSVILSGPWQDDAPAWMAMTPCELESQEIGIAAAYGHTAVLGMGMGWAAANVALNPAVTQVSVVERDADVIALIDDLGIFAQLPPAAHEKITVIEADALHWRPETPVDSLQADFWAKFVEPQKWDDVHRIQANIGALSVYFWGQEMELWRLACRARGAVPQTIDDAELDALIAGTGLPLVPCGPAARFAEAARWWTPQTEGWWA